jgi:hypothetical protein
MSQNKTREEDRAWWAEHCPNYPHMLRLDDEFPSVGMFEPWCISASVGPGWETILRPVLRVLAKHGCHAGQVKSKFCELVVYWHHPEVKYVDMDPAVVAQIETVLDVAAELSLHMCEDCGIPVVEGGGRPIAGRRNCVDCRKTRRWR